MSPKDSILISKDSLEKILKINTQNMKPPIEFNWGDFGIIIALIIASGVLGGIVNYYLNFKKAGDTGEPHTVERSVIVGIGAAFLVPVFLEITQSKVLTGVASNELIATILFIGFCTLAAIVSSSFISSVSESVLTRLKKVEKQADDATKKADVSVAAIEQRGGTKIAPATKNALKTAPVPAPEIYAEDPLKGQFGGVSKKSGYELLLTSAEAIESVKDWYNLTFSVRAIDPSKKELTGEVIFFLHPTFKPDVIPVKVNNGVALLSRIAWGSFTIGAQLPDGTRLEYDLAADPHLPQDFRDK